MIVCLCENVTREDLIEAKEVICGEDCGSCLAVAQEIIESLDV